MKNYQWSSQINMSHQYPLKDKDFEINAQFEFPNTDEGRKKSTEFNSFINTGKPIELDGRYIKEFELPDEFIRIFGEVDPEKLHLQMGPTDPYPLFLHR